MASAAKTRSPTAESSIFHARTNATCVCFPLSGRQALLSARADHSQTVRKAHTHADTQPHTHAHTHTHHRYNNSSGGGADSPLSVTWPGSAPSVVLATMKTLTRMRITARFFCSSSLLGDRRRHVDSSLKTQDNSPCHSDRGANVVVN